MRIVLNKQKNTSPLSTYRDTIDHTGKAELLKEFYNLVQNGVIVNKSFNDSLWLVAQPIELGTFFHLDFNKVKINNYIIDSDSIKYWVISQLINYESSTASIHFNDLRYYINLTNCFSPKNINMFHNFIYNNHDVTKNFKYQMATTTLNFIYYSDIQVDSRYIRILNRIKATFYKKLNNRSLPKSRNILNFSYLLEHFYNDYNDVQSSNSDKIRLQELYFPILIWWKLTTIIPMRVGEFCHIKKDGLIKKKDQFFISFKRIKFDKRIDTFEINEETYNLINHYIRITKKYLNSEFLLSYDALIKLNPTNSRLYQSNNKLFLSRGNFYNLLISFYNNIIDDYYNVHIPKAERLTPSDTRHISIMSLMLQGFSPFEVASFSGHASIEKQYNYSFHPEYWLDNEIYQLQNKVKFEEENLLLDLQDIPSNILSKALTPTMSEYRGELKIGYCSDEEMRCESTNSCLLCSHWRIDKEDYKKNKKAIIKEVYDYRKSILESAEFIKTTFYQITNQKKNDEIPEILSDKYYQTLEDIHARVHNLNKLTQLINQRSDYYQKSR